jgi:hypothetical protein
MTPTTIVAILTQARALIERGWTKGASARNQRERRVDYLDPTAIRWCSVGALSCAAHRENVPWEATRPYYDAAAEHLRKSLPVDVAPYDDTDSTIVGYNDTWHVNKNDILALFDRAIASAQLAAAAPAEPEAQPQAAVAEPELVEV